MSDQANLQEAKLAGGSAAHTPLGTVHATRLTHHLDGTCSRPFARLLSHLAVGWASNVQPSVRTNYALIKGLSILGCRAGESVRRGFVDPAARMAALHGWIREGKLQPSVSLSVDIHRAQEAFEAVHKREVVGKAVLTLDGSHAGDTLAAKL